MLKKYASFVQIELVLNEKGILIGCKAEWVLLVPARNSQPNVERCKPKMLQ
jgi:hypothetical protein